jgi:muramidase (phage lysozyme)
MPEISRFFGIIVRMFAEVGEQHHLPHFHAYYQDHVAVIGIAPVELLAGSLPARQKRLAEAWAELHQDELLADWQRLQSGQRPLPIDPLR